MSGDTRYKRKLHCLEDDIEEDLSNSGNNSKRVEINDEKAINDCSNSVDSKDLSKITIEEFKMKEFNSEHEAYLFYLDYSKCVGFGVRRDDSGRDKNGTYIWQRYVCVCEGKARKKQTECIEPKRRPRTNKRIGCLAHLKVKLNIETSKWYVYNFEPNHNHALVLSSYSHLIPSHRRMTDADKAFINSMLGHGLKAAATMDYMTGIAGGPNKVGFTRKDMYNYTEKQRKIKVLEGDAQSALNYLLGKADSDPNFFVRHTLNSESCLENLFWCDGHSQVDYKCFGEVIAFDTTYKINKYNKPFVIFSGVNHHGNNIIFASALLVDECKETYIWVLEKLMEVMQNKKPHAVVTDGDKAMCKAIEVVFPDACHRLCTWHLAKNATSNIHSEKFTQEMSRCIYANVDIDIFEAEWKSLIERFSLSDNKWVEKMYKKRHMWANAYLRDKFFAGIRTTSRCESTNSFFKKYLKSHYNLLEFVQHFERGMKITRYKEVEADYHSLYNEEVSMTTINHVLEHYASKIYTRHALELFRKQLKICADCMVIGVDNSDGNCQIYKVEKYLSPGVIVYVTTKNDTKMINCCCYTFESTGIPCGHIIAVLKFNHIRELPECIVLKRWTKEAKNIVPPLNESDLSAERLTDLRFGSLSVRCNYMSYLASNSAHTYNETREDIEKIISRLEIAHFHSKNSQNSDQCGKVNDPKITKTKGCPKKKDPKGKRQIHCGNCKETGHTRRRCPHPIIEDLSIKGNGSNSSSDDDIIDNSKPISSDHLESPSTYCDVKSPQVSVARYGVPLTNHNFPQSASSLLSAMQGNHFPQMLPTTFNFIGQGSPLFASNSPIECCGKVETSTGNYSEHPQGLGSYNPHAFYWGHMGCTKDENNPSNDN